MPRAAWPVIYLSPRGPRFDQARARALSAGPGMTLLCGRFEGVDERVLDFLMHADIEFMLKERLWGIFAMRQSFAARMQALDAVDLPAELRGPISELLLASP